MKVFVVVYEHKYDTDIVAFYSHDKAYKHVADIAREWWNDRVDEDAPDDPSGLSDEQVIAAYFDENEKEFYEIRECEVE